MSHIAVFFADGFEEIEALTVVDLCRRAGIEADMVSVTGKKNVNGSHGIIVEADLLFEEVDFSALDMLVLPGGKNGTIGLEAHVGLMEKIDEYYKEKKYIAAICAAPSIFGHRGILKGRNACSYPAFESQLDGAKVTEGPVEASEHVVTSRGMGTSIDFGLKIVEIFKGKEAAEALAAQIVYRQ